MFKHMFAVLAVLLLCQSGMAQGPSVKAADKDADGKVTIKEFTEYAGTKLQGADKDQVEAFAKKVDANGDGEVTEKEFGNRMQALQSVMNDSDDAADEKESMEDSKPHVVGDKASDFELQSIGKNIKLSDVVSKSGKPVVVVFSRANW